MTEQTHANIKDLFETFLKNFKSKTGELKYRSIISKMVSDNSESLLIDFKDILQYDDQLSRQLIDDPDSILLDFNKAAFNALYSENPEYADAIRDTLQVRFHSLIDPVPLRNITTDVLHKLIAVEGMVVRTSELKPRVLVACFICKHGHPTSEPQSTSTLTKPLTCSDSDCSESRIFDFDEKRSKFQDFQIIRIQELPEALPAGQLPQAFDVNLSSDLVNRARPGDRLTLTGIIRTEAQFSRGTDKLTIFRTRIDGNNIDIEAKGPEDIVLSREDEEQIKEIAKTDNAYELLINSIAPAVHGLDTQKEAILLMLIGAPNKILKDHTSLRGDINVLFVGDPGTAKSELLKYASRLAPRGLYASGKGSTAAGLTAAVIRERSGTMMLEAGTVVLADQGLACIDEFDKMRSEDRSALHEAMEQQTVSIAKGGIIATLNARTAILAASNPQFGKYDSNRNITENINIPPPLLTRFDLVFAIHDSPERTKDTNLAQYILDIHKTGEITKSVPVEFDLLKKYIIFAKRLEPQLSSEAEQKILEFYLLMRQSGASEEQITVTPRSLEGLIRLSSARARSLFHEIITEEDAMRGISLMKRMFATVGTDVATGKFDYGVFQGKALSERSKTVTAHEKFHEMENNSKEGLVDRDEFVKELVNTGKFKEGEAEKMFQSMADSGQIYNVRNNFYRKVR